MEKVTSNSFSKGRNSDIDPRFQSLETYLDAQNISITSDGDFFAAKNIKGGTEVKEILASLGATDYNVLGAFECIGTFFSYGTEEKNPTIVIFTKTSPTIDNVFVYDIKRATLHTVFSGNLNFPIEGTIDAIVFGEKNRDRIYFDDHINTLRGFDITDNTIPNARFLTVRPYAPVDPLTFKNVQEGSGQNASGTYQIAYQYYHTITKKHTTYSPLTQPIPIYPPNISDVSSFDEIYGGVPNEITSKSIVLSIASTPANTDNYNAIRLAVVKNTNGNKTPELIAYLTSINEDWFNNPSNIVYDGSGLEETVDIAEIVTEDAAIKNAKTLVAKDNVLFRGNINYNDLDVESITYGSAETITTPIGLSGDVYSPTKTNTNNPAFVGLPAGLGTGETHPTEFGSAVTSSIMRIYHTPQTDFNPQENHTPNPEPITFVSELSVVPGHMVDSLANLTIPTGIQPGNEFHFKIAYDPEGMQNYVASTNTGVRSEYLLASYFGLGLTFPAWLVALGLLPATSYVELFADYSYIVVDGDTPETVATKIATQINGFGDTSKLEVLTSGSTLQFRNRIPSTPRGGLQDRFGICDIEFWTFQGQNTKTTVDDTALQNLINNPETSTDGGYKNPRNCVYSKGYWRDEVYRFGITYMDEFGNWSRPVPFDFTANNANTVVGAPVAVGGVTLFGSSAPNRMGLAAIQPNVALGVTAGDLVFLNPNGYKLVMGITGTNGVLVEVGKDEVMAPSTISATKGGEFSFASSGTDWKFPTRSNKHFPMMTNLDSLGNFNENGFMNPMGLKILGITNHPTWAKAFDIVRVRRLKNILWQSPHIAAIAAMPSTLETGFTDGCDTPTTGGDPTGAYGPKVLSKGVAKNLERNSAVTITTEDLANRKAQNSSRGNITPISICVPPDYMYQNQGINFGTALFPSGGKIQIVDAVSFFRTPEFDVDGSGADDGDNAGDQIGVAMRADSAGCYYYKDIGGILSMNTYPFSKFFEQFETGGKENVLDYGQVVNRGTQYTFPTQPLADNFHLKRINKYGLEPVSLQNCGNELIMQKAAVLLMKSSFGDLSYYAKNGSISVPASQALNSFDFSGESLFYPPTLSAKYNVGETAFTRSGSFDNVNIITDTRDGSCGVVPVVNLIREIEDDRYGKVESVHEFISTGCYHVIAGPNDTKDVEVFGGDCFIAKHNVKISDSTLERFQPKRVLALTDHQEILSLYLESNVNCDLQASQFTYPVLRKVALGPFSADFLYPYNFGYSVENEVKTWISKSNIDTNRLSYPARIIFSDQKVFQSDVEGFDRYRALSFYDLPEEYGGITKLIKLANDNVYSIQARGVCVIPINKNVLEDGNGSQIVVNSTTLINKPQYILNKNGSQHIRSVKASDTSIFFMDAKNREVFKIGGDSDGKISDNGMYSAFLQELTTISGIPDRKVVAGYDLNNNEYWIGVNKYTDVEYIVDPQNPTGPTIPQNIQKDTFLSLWSDKMGAWTSDLVIAPTTKIDYFVFANSLSYILGQKTATNVVLEEMYTGQVTGRILGEINQSKIKISINPDEPIGKVFDVLRIDANERLDSLVMTVFKETGVASQIANMNLNIKPRHDGYELPVLRDANRQRLRGKYCIAEFTMNNGDNREIKITGILTKYRVEARIFK